MADVLDRESGEVVQIPDDQVRAAFLSGRYGLPQGARIDVVSPDGQLGSIDAEEAEAAFGEGFDFAPAAAVREAQNQADYGEGIGSEALAGLAGAGRALTFGASDVLASGVGDFIGADTRGALNELRERNPLSTGAGEVVGTLGSLLLPGAGEANAILRGARAATAAPRVIAGVGRAAENTALRLLGTEAAESAASRILGRGISAGAGAGAEGVAYGAGQLVTESALTDPDLTAEQIAAHLGMSALWSGGAGGLLGGLGRAGREGYDATRNALMRRAGTEATEEASQELGSRVGRLMSPQAVDDFITSSAFQAAGAMKRDIDAAAQRAGGVSQIGRDALDLGVVTAASSVDDIAERAAREAEKWGARVGELVRGLDGQNAVRPDGNRIMRRVQEEVLDRLGDNPFFDDIRRTVERDIRPFASRFATTADEAGNAVAGEALGFEQLHKIRQGMDDLIYRNKLSNSPIVAELRAVRGILEDEIETAGAEAARSVGDAAFRDAYQQAKRLYGSMKTVRDMAADRVRRNDANRWLSPSDYGLAISGGLGGAVISSADGDTDPGAIAIGFLSGLAHKFARERGRAFLAAGLDKISRVGAIQRTAQTVARQTDEGVNGFFRNLSSTARETGQRARRAVAPLSLEAYERTAGAAKSFSEDPRGSSERLAQATEGVSRGNPEIGAALQSQAVRGANFLVSRLPATRQTNMLQPHLARPRPSDTEMSKFLRYARAVDDPLSILDDMEGGRLTREGVEVLKEVYPRLYQDVVKKVTERLADEKEPLPYEARLQIGTLLGVPTDPSLLPENIASFQETYAVTAQPQQAAARPQTPAPELASSLQTDAQRIAQR